MNSEQTAEITRLRALNLSPKQIAHKLGLKPTEVSQILRSLAENSAIASKEKGELPHLERCLINEKAAQKLLDGPQKSWFGLGQGQKSEEGTGGLAQIFVIRKDRNNYLLCSYLVDYWCLGVKNALGPRKLGYEKHQLLITNSYQTFGQKYREISLEQAQAIIFGAVDYAAQMGLKPHRDFEKAKAHLGTPLENYPAIEFGRQGKPFFIAGPHDNYPKIIARLKATLGEGNFDYIVPLIR